MRAMRASVVYMSMYQRANMPKACQLLIFKNQSAKVPINVPTLQRTKGVPIIQIGVPTCQRAKGVPIFQLGVPTCQKVCQFFNFTWQKGLLFFKRVFNFWIFQLCVTFTNFKNIWALLKNLSRETNNLTFDICKISLMKNLINLKSLTSFSVKHMGLTEQLRG